MRKKSDQIFAVLLTCLILVAILLDAGSVRAVNPPRTDYKLYDYKIVRVLDGDTVEVEAPYLPKELRSGGLKLRILGVDTPEKGHLAKCSLENQRSLAAKLFVEQQISAARNAKIWLKGWDKYGGRVLGDVFIDGQWLSAMLISKGYAIEYDGSKKEKDWCK